mmetsp:Transcript_7244/g.14832  ORF Transcript_7244/g.14832 Transcript_7244/m.14832 type:complete len:197 (-) Transcript_7244:363-953(-)
MDLEADLRGVLLRLLKPAAAAEPPSSSSARLREDMLRDGLPMSIVLREVEGMSMLPAPIDFLLRDFSVFLIQFCELDPSFPRPVLSGPSSSSPEPRFFSESSEGSATKEAFSSATSTAREGSSGKDSSSSSSTERAALFLPSSASSVSLDGTRSQPFLAGWSSGGMGSFFSTKPSSSSSSSLPPPLRLAALHALQK